MTGLALAISRGYHKMSAPDMGSDLRQRLAGFPQVSFEALEVGQVVYTTNVRGDRRRDCFQVTKTTPKRRQLEAHRFDDDKTPFRAYKGDYTGDFYVIDDEMISLMFVTHEDVVREAVRMGLEVAAEARCCHPALFIELPERFEPKKLEEALKPQWGLQWGTKMTAERIDARIEGCRDNIRLYQQALAPRKGKTAARDADYDKFQASINGYEADIEFYLWLRPHVSPGGVFYTGEPEAPAWQDAPPPQAARPAAARAPYLPFVPAVAL